MKNLLLAEMTFRGYSRRTVAQKIKMDYQKFRRKVNNPEKLTVQEVYEICSAITTNEDESFQLLKKIFFTK